MSTDTQTQDTAMGTAPINQHDWLQKLIGEWKTEGEMYMPDGSTFKGEGTEIVTSLNGLWALAEGTTSVPGGTMEYRKGLGYDVSFKEYRGFMVMGFSSHLWKSTGTLSADGRTMTLDCIGPDMVRDGETANYRDVIEILDDNHRTLTSYGEDENGEWQTFMRADFTRIV